MTRLLAAAALSLAPAAALAHHPEEGGAMIEHAMEAAPVLALLVVAAGVAVWLRRRRG